MVNARKFIFSLFASNIESLDLHSEAGCVSWSNIHEIYDSNVALEGNLRMAHKLTYKALHPGNNIQNAASAITIFYESTIAACKRYYPEKKDVAAFLTLINACWTIVNAKHVVIQSHLHMLF